MSKFRYAIPESIRPLLIVNKITSVEKLIDYVENHPKKFFPEMYATFLWQNIMEKEVFFYYQLHVYDGKLPFLLNFHPLTQRKFLHLGVFDEETLKAFVRKNQSFTITLLYRFIAATCYRIYFILDSIVNFRNLKCVYHCFSLCCAQYYSLYRTINCVTNCSRFNHD